MDEVKHVEDHTFLNPTDPLLQVQMQMQNTSNQTQQNLQNINAVTTHEYKTASSYPQANAQATISGVIATPFQKQQHESFIELDSHADTTCVGANCYIIAYTDKVCPVSPYHPKYKAVENVPIVQAGTALLTKIQARLTF